MKFYRFMPAVAVAVALSMTSCGGEDGDSNEPVDVQFNVEETKEFVSQTASELMSKFKAEEQKELIDLLNHIEQNYGHISFEDESDSYPYRAIGRSTEVIDLVNDYTGIYTPQGNEWVKTGSSADLIFRAPDARYGTIELKVTRSSNSLNVTVDDYGDNYTVIVPKSAKAVLTASGRSMLTIDVTADYNATAKTISASETVTGANIKWVSNVTGTNSLANATSSLVVNGETVLTAKGSVNGRNLTDISSIQNALEDEDFSNMFSNGTFEGDVLGKMQLKGNILFSEDLFEAADEWFEYGPYYEYSSAAAASAACDRALSVLNRGISANVMFNGGSDSRASLTFIKDNYSYTDWQGNECGEYYTMPALKFPDGTTYTDEFFSEGFDAIVSQWEKLVNSYARLWN